MAVNDKYVFIDAFYNWSSYFSATIVKGQFTLKTISIN